MATARTLTTDDIGRNKPIYAVWETTMQCNHACAHCGSRAGPDAARPRELDTSEIMAVAAQLVDLGTREVTLIGGEAYLRDDIIELVTFLSGAGVRVTMQTGGRGLSLALCKELRQAGMAAIGVSIDGPARVHDVLRASPGSFLAGMRALENARAAGMTTTSNLQVNRLNRDHLRETCELLSDSGILVWRVQLTVPMGRAADRPEWILQPWEILGVMDTLAELQTEHAEHARKLGLPPHQTLDILASNNLGYYGPHEELLRSRPGRTSQYWTGCSAGRYTMGIESDGTVKGCPSLPTAPYVGGNVTEVSLRDIWQHADELQFVRDRSIEELWGFCRTCYYGDICRAGCSFTTHCTLGRRGNNPFCYHRAATLQEQGVRERLVHKVDAAGQPYDFGRFELELEPWPEQPGDGDPTP
ncbi:MAG: radical SAM protein [Myxococcota bacterium]|jgi:radical SAM protein with 4Fe4S-binding SPASM domain|nr:radical SAM protein [Myxococcota bacterium]